MKSSLIALFACCAVGSSAFAVAVNVPSHPPLLRLTDDIPSDMPGDHPPQLRLTYDTPSDMPGDHPPQLRLTYDTPSDMPGDHPPQATTPHRLHL